VSFGKVVEITLVRRGENVTVCHSLCWLNLMFVWSEPGITEVHSLRLAN